MNLGLLCQIILKSDKEISGYGKLAKHAIFAYHMVRQTPLIALHPLRFPGNILTNQTVSVLFSLSEFLRAEEGLTGVYETKFVKVCQIFNEVKGAVRRESVTELENPLNP